MSTFFTPKGKTLPPLTPETIPDSYTDPAGGKRPWYRRTWFYVIIVVVVVAGASVIADLPHHASRSAQVSQAKTLVTSVDGDIRTCTYSLEQTITIYDRHLTGSLTAAQRKEVPGLLSQNEQACSFANQAVVDLGTITVPSGTAGTDLGNMITNVEVWMTSDAVATISDMEQLIVGPSNTATQKNLTSEEKLLDKDRTKADADITQARKALGSTQVPDPALPAAPPS